MNMTAGGTPGPTRTGGSGRSGGRGGALDGAGKGDAGGAAQSRGGGDMPGAVTAAAPVLRSAGGIRGTDAAGVAVLACCAAWTLVAAAGRPARPDGTMLALLAVAAGYAAGRVLGALLPALAPAAAAAAALGLVLVPPSPLTGRPGPPPLGYANADAALLVLAAGAACCAAWDSPGRVRPIALHTAAAGAAVAALVLGSAAGFAAGTGVVLCSLAVARTRRRAPGLALLALAAVIAVGGSCAVAVGALPPGLSQSLSGQLTQPRVALWHQAVTLTEHHPLRGVGPDRFADSETSEEPADAAQAADAGLADAAAAASSPTPQSAPLQLAAEQGVPGAVLLAAAFGWVLLALARSCRPTPVVLTAGAALTGLALLASVDHVLSYAVVTAGAGFLAGAATARPLAEDGWAPPHASR